MNSVFGEDKTVAAIEVAVLLDNAAMPANSLVHTESCRTSGQIAKSCFDGLYKLVAYVLAAPFVKDGTKKFTISLGLYRVVGYTMFGVHLTVDPRGKGYIAYIF